MSVIQNKPPWTTLQVLTVSYCLHASKNLQQAQGKHQAHTLNGIHAVGVQLCISTLLCSAKSEEPYQRALFYSCG